MPPFFPKEGFVPVILLLFLFERFAFYCAVASFGVSSLKCLLCFTSGGKPAHCCNANLNGRGSSVHPPFISCPRNNQGEPMTLFFFLQRPGSGGGRRRKKRSFQAQKFCPFQIGGPLFFLGGGRQAEAAVIKKVGGRESGGNVRKLPLFVLFYLFFPRPGRGDLTRGIFAFISQNQVCFF